MSWAKTKRAKISGFFGIVFVSILAITGVTQQFASAAYLGDRPLQYGYFYNQYGGLGGPGVWDDVIVGGIPNTADKQTYINYLTNKFYNGNQHDKTGASFIINLQLGRGGSNSHKVLDAAEINEWAVRIQQPEVTFSMQDYTFSYNSAYDIARDDALFYPDSDRRYSLVIRYNGVIVSVVKQDCANPLDGNSGIPKPDPLPSVATLEGYNLEENTGNQVSGNVSVSLVGTEVNRSAWYFNSNVAGHNPSIPQGWHDVWIDNIPLGYSVIGSTLCGGNSPCNAGQPSSSTSGQNFAAGGFRTIDFQGGSNYHLRWILRKTSLSCLPPPLVSPAEVERTTLYTVRAGAIVSPASSASAAASGGTVQIYVVRPDGTYAYNQVRSLTASGNTISASVQPGPTNGTGRYAVFYTITTVFGSITCGDVVNPADTFTVADHPYFSILGGDVRAGAGFGASCTENASAGIRAYNSGSIGGFKGAGTELAAFARATITGFATGTNPSSGASTSVNTIGRPGSLAFSNTDLASLGNVGSVGCAPDYAGEAITSGATVHNSSANSVNVATLDDGVYDFSGFSAPVFTINGGSIGNNKRITIIVNGDAVITSNILYAPYTDLANAPSLTIITKGHKLHIESDVQILTGFFVAQGTNGIISTCSVAAGSNWIESITPADCGNPLTINGALSADTIHFNRTRGSLTGPPAETIQFSPELWAASLLNCGGDVRLCSSEDDYIVSLPPIL